MIDHALQCSVAVLIFVGVVGFLWRTRRSRVVHPPVGWRRTGRFVARLALVFVSLLAFLFAVEATRYMDADICIDTDPGSEWCLHEATDDTG